MTDDTCVQEYEGLRDHVLTGSTVLRPCGLIVLLRHGLAAWSTRRQVGVAAKPRTPRTASTTAPTTPPHHIVDDRHAALVPVLLDMVLSRHQEVHL